MKSCGPPVRPLPDLSSFRPKRRRRSSIRTGRRIYSHRRIAGTGSGWRSGSAFGQVNWRNIEGVLMRPKPKHLRPIRPKETAKPRRAPRIVRPGVSYFLLPHDFARALARWKIGNAGWLLLVEIDWLVFHARRNPVKFTNTRWQSLRGSRWTKIRALRRLEKAGVVRVSILKNQAPEVTCLWRPVT